MITTVMLVQRFATKTLYTRARATDGSTMLAPMSLGAGKGLTYFNPFPALIPSEGSSAFHADARLRARRRP